MRCIWSDKQAYRYADNLAGDDDRESFALHLASCPDCRAAAAEAGGIDALLRETLVPVEPPSDLAARIAAGIPAPSLTRSGWSRVMPFSWPRTRTLSLAAALVLALALLGGALLAPGDTVAQVRQWLYFVPGIGITATNDTTLAARGPVVVRNDGLTFTLEALLSDGKSTRVQFRLNGIPGGKEGWNEKSRPASEPGEGKGKTETRTTPTMPFLRDSQGRMYKMLNGSTGVGGSPQENIVKGEITFGPLPGNLEHVELVMPLEWVVPATVVSEPRELVVPIDLVHLSSGGFAPAREMGQEATANGITMRVLGVAFTREGTVVQLEARPGDEREQVVQLGGALEPSELRAVLTDGRGREYRPEPTDGGVVPRPYLQSLTFREARGEPRDLSVRIDRVLVMRDASVTFSVPISGRKTGEKFDLNMDLTLDGYRLRVLSGELMQESDDAWLNLYLDLGAGKNGRKLTNVQPSHGSQSSSFLSSYDDRTRQVNRVGLPVGEVSGEVQITFRSPTFEVSGPWQIALPMP